MDLSPSTTTGCKQLRLYGWLFLYQELDSSDSLQPSGVLRKDKLSNFSILKSGFRLLWNVASPPNRKMANKCVCVCVGVITDDIP